MSHPRTRRTFPPRSRPQRRRHAVRPEPAEPRLRQPVAAQAAAGRHVQPQRRRPRRRSGRTKKATTFTLKESLTPLEPFKDRTLILHGVCDHVRGDGDNHMRGIGCLLTGIELFPGNIQGGSDTPAGWASGISIDQEIKNFLQNEPGHAHALRLARIRRHGARPRRHLDAHGLRRPEQADRADRRSRTRCSTSSTASMKDQRNARAASSTTCRTT